MLETLYTAWKSGPFKRNVNQKAFQGQSLIFLISQPRAGSTLLQRILGGHTEIHTAAEPWLMLHPLYALREQGVETEFNATYARNALRDFLTYQVDGEATYQEAVRAYAGVLYGRALQKAGKSLFLDKTPRYYYIIPELAHLFPEARFIILLRHPLAILASILQTWVKGHWPNLALYRDDLLLAPRLLLDGIRLLGEEAIVVHYETLVVQPEETIKTICRRLDLSFQPEMLQYGKQEPPAGRMGDPVTIHIHNKPMAGSLDSWVSLFETAQGRHFIESYLSELGPEILAELGYPLPDIQAALSQIPQQRLFPIFPWDLALRPPAQWTQPERFRAACILRLQRHLPWQRLHKQLIPTTVQLSAVKN